MPVPSHEAVVCSVLEAIDRHDLDALKVHPGLYETVQHMPSLWASFPDARHTVERGHCITVDMG